MTPEDFLQQVAWLGVQPSSIRGGDTFGTGNDDVPKTRADEDYVTDITATQGSRDPWPAKD